MPRAVRVAVPWLGLGLGLGLGLNKHTYARFCFITVEAGRDACIRWAVTGELLGPHAPSALLELSYPRSRARRVLKANGKPPASRGAPHRTRTEERSGCSPACGPGSVGHLVYLV